MSSKIYQPPPDLIIKSQKNIFDINLKEIWEYRDLIVLMVRRDFISQIKQTVLGPLWYVITPTVSIIVYSIIFSGIANISTEGVPPALFYLTGLTLWGYFSMTLISTSNTFIANAGIFGKVYFPRLVSPISMVISSLLKFSIQFCLLAVLIIVYSFKGYSIDYSLNLLWIPIVIIITGILAFGIGIIISSLTTKYKDFRNLLTLVIQLWMYATPIIYPVSIIPEKYKWIILINPMTPLIETFKMGLIGVGSVELAHIGYSAFCSLFVLCIGVVLFSRVENTFMDTV
jgi:lipopolysaccharide transport system permease protein